MVNNLIRPLRQFEAETPGGHAAHAVPRTNNDKRRAVKKTVTADLGVAAKLEEPADRGGVGLTPHAVAIDRALAAVAAVNDTIDKMGSTGELKAFNRAFKEARRVDPSSGISTISRLERRRCSRRWPASSAWNR
jgi:hypothetical protein